ncbi:DMT family transporter [Vibrio quintilis]|uniref:Putative inner membrane transporter YhbE n=1 Tax=Vibrio quintilis TaxID=1117707 RepID=A0A1M7YWI9_9VIBR|nr:DMT family transporter [Vibrio quintilis]SHO56952.1 putative inner membrane transporter YhbE [Vibrio quintilis]
MAGTLLIMVACLTWAIDTLIRYPLLGAGYTTLQVVFTEHLILTVLMLPFGWRYRHHFRQLSWRMTLCMLFIGGVGSALGTLAFTEAFHYLNPTLVILLQKLQPVIAILLACFVLKERIQSSFLLWACVLIAGSLIMMWSDILSLAQNNLHATRQGSDIIKGYLYALGAVVAWGGATVCGKYLSQQACPPNAILFGRFFSGFCVLALFVSLQPSAIKPMEMGDWESVAIMACLSGLAGMWFYYQGLRYIPARRATLVELTFPVFAAAVNWLFLGQTLSFYQIVGGVVLLAGNLGLQLRETKKVIQPTRAALSKQQA